MPGVLTIQPVLSPQIISISEFTICLLGYRKTVQKRPSLAVKRWATPVREGRVSLPMIEQDIQL
ncbi:hypothetical protein AL056_21800 [Pseudomonas amygdali pv. morsprunorum]|nr:hypothetical protein AL056_21800 [Pseudomonas amygdali pv. morsprunorum]KWS67531.1 hypothetical protein AL054_22665 [Pseudomonas amygdali pv. morsprunorum]PHX28698.1 hypothetical protein AO282_16060 [Pseudomonas amygdali pv. morsprunorum]POC82201.1 hypothetical protein BKM08_26840 [Pseudomonas amygdali pv. morsprunorum]